MHIHILGIAGTFMGGLALIARAAGHTVTGCDSGIYPPMSTQLAEQGIQLIEGFDADQIALQPDLFIVGNVVSRGNPLMEAILDRQLPYTSGPQWLGDHILRHQHVLAVAGTHGKTTTSSLLAWVLEQAGLQPNFLIGGIANDFGVSARYHADQPLFVIEADEYDTAFFDKRSKFLHYHARTLVLNNLEYDHADIFPNIDAIETQFHHLLRTLPSQAQVISPSAHNTLQRVLDRGVWSSQCHFSSTIGVPADWQCDDISPTGNAFTVLHQGQAVGRVQWALVGDHNRHNALACLAAAHHVGVSPEQGIKALNCFGGIRRRMEQRGKVNNIVVYDDFAHHPTAIATTIAGLKATLPPGDRLIAVLDPRSNTMKMGAMANQLPASLAQADHCFCYVPTQGKHALQWSPQQLLSPFGIAIYEDIDALCQALCDQAQPGDHFLLMSNGSFMGLHDRLLEALRHRFVQ